MDLLFSLDDFSKSSLLNMLFASLFVLFLSLVYLIYLLLKNKKLVKKIADLASKLLNTSHLLQEVEDRLPNANEEYKKITGDIKSMKNELDFFIDIMGRLNFPVWRRDENLDIKFCNQHYLYMVGSNRDNSGTIAELHKDIKKLAVETKDSHEIHSESMRIIVNGNRCLYKITEIPSLGKGTVGFAQDITSLEDKEREIQEHSDMQSNLMESSRAAIAVFGSDQKIKFYNASYIALWKLSESWLDSQPTYSEILEILREKQLLPEQVNFQDFKKEQTAYFNNLIKKHEEFLYLPNGTVLRVIIIPHQKGGLLFSYEDLTDQINLERSYNTAMSVKRYTLDNLQEGIAVFGEDGRLQLCNPIYLKMWGLSDNTFESEMHISDIIELTRDYFDFGDNWEYFKKELVAHATTREMKTQKLERSDGIILELATIPLPDGATLLSFLDVTAGYRLEQSLRAEQKALKESDQLKNSFLANVSYELRSPLTTIQGFSELLLQEHFGEMNGRQEEHVKDIYDSCLRLNDLIDNMLDVASIDAGHLMLENTEFSMSELLESVASDAKQKSSNKNLSFKFNSDKKIKTITGDRRRIRQVLVNLLGNAIDHTDEGGKIDMDAKISKGNLQVIITDNGKGIAEDEKHLVFEKFYKTPNNNLPGTGLGLTVAKNIIEMHGGSVMLESELEKGTKVTCIIPLKNKK